MASFIFPTYLFMCYDVIKLYRENIKRSTEPPIEIPDDY